MTLGMLALVFGGGTLVLSGLLPFIVKPLLMRLGIMDVPSDRSSHDRPILRGLGLAVLIAITVNLGAVFAFALSAAPDASAWKFLLAIGIGTLAAGLLGLGEDLRGLSVPVRSALLLIIAGASSASLLWIADQAEGPASFRWVLGLDVWALPLWGLIIIGVYGVFFISSYINVSNFMDGLNGISGFHGVIAGLAFAVAGWLTGAVWLAIAGLVLAAGFAGFLPWNLTKPGAFLGDVGSYLLGEPSRS
ncbi:hypothetical protein [Leucobacter viscericola]|uniref:hypothetical protein n=1 Tax=Leucobacter viscericola TaxID=2714935 RepID=UPI001FCC88F7|nr:hypothetical protein [Leucobacter viscericola]